MAVSQYLRLVERFVSEHLPWTIVAKAVDLPQLHHDFPSSSVLPVFRFPSQLQRFQVSASVYLLSTLGLVITAVLVIADYAWNIIDALWFLHGFS